ncbi:MAG: hypothetical protein M0P70_08555 [Desulfobulbaceae bacterium]|nr:hypothetical protein [Desulfobulbaceae bacterium]
MISEDIKKNVADLVDGGAVFTIHNLGDIERLESTVGLLEFDDNNCIRWCTCFPEDQHHFHVFQVYGVRMINKFNFDFLTDYGLVSLNILEPYSDDYKSYWHEWVKVRDTYRGDMVRMF